MISDYQSLIKKKENQTTTKSKEIKVTPHPNAKPHQADCLEMLLSVRRGAAFLDTGLGKTFVQLDWARHVPGKVIIVTPLAVAQQTIREADKLLGMTVGFSNDGIVKERVTVTNYERLHLFDCSQFSGVVLDESSILKGKNSKTRAQLTESFKDAEYKLCCTATPAPNDYTEIGNHAEFLGIMSQIEMLMRWFVHDSANTADWRLKKHAVKDFWEWVSGWAACVSKPSDLGHDDEGYNLPPLVTKTHIVRAPIKHAEGMLFDIPGISATELHGSKRETINERCEMVAEMINASDKPWIVWCESNEESALLSKLIPDAVEVKGGDSFEKKEKSLIGFTDGESRVIISKPSICGFGMNWQHCRNIAFASISYSYEKFYQAVRRSWRFGQTEKVFVHVVIADCELEVWRSIERKTANHDLMKSHMKHAVFRKSADRVEKISYDPQKKVNLASFLSNDKD